MENSLVKKLTTFNPQRPHVWEMKITEDEFVVLEGELCGDSPDYGEKTDALKVLVYLAEWYKRRYTNRTKKAYQKTFHDEKPDLKAVWETLDIDKKYLYEGENGQKLYLYSTFILSGLAVKFERQKNEKPFLRALCRVYNKEDESFDRVVDSNHSIAFKESIAQGHCLHDFLEAIITSQDDVDALPYAEEDVKNANTEIALLIGLIREINYEVNKSKFRLEWIVSAIPGDNLVSRRLHIWLNPEEKGKLHQLLRVDRLKKWGFECPEDMCYIRLGVRYFNGNIIVKEPDFHHPELYYRNTGDGKIGFICEKVDYANCNNVPVVAFDKVQLIAWNEDGTELRKPVQEETADFDAMQLYRIEAGEDEWTSRTLQQRETALLFTDKWAVADNSVDKSTDRKTYYNKRYGEGDTLNWCYIHASATIENESETRTFYDRQGNNHIVAHQYKETIQYTEDGKVLLHESEDPESPETTTPISLIFGKEDIIAYHTETKDEGEEDVCEMTEVELFEFKKDNRYVVWSEAERPEPGRIDLRLTVKAKTSLFKAFYIPKPIERDLGENSIHYFNNGKEETYNDKEAVETAIHRRQILEPTVTINIGTKTCYVSVPVFRPVNLKEVCYDGKILMYDTYGKVSIPYILKEYVDVNDYGAAGYRSYPCRDFRNVFVELNNSDYLLSGKYTSAIDGKTFSDQQAPEGVTFFVRKSLSKNPRLRYCYWNCMKDTKPIPVRELVNFDLPSGCVLFQDQRRINDRLQCEYMEKEAKGFAKIKKKGQNDGECTLTVFLVASEYNQYFFHFKALRQLANGIKEKRRDFFEEIYTPLLNQNGNDFTMKEHKDMLRFADEFCLDELKEQLINKFINIR